MPFIPPAMPKFFCGMDFANGASSTTVYFLGGRGYGQQPMQYWRWALGQVSAEELVGGRASTKSLYLKPSERKSKAEDKKAKMDKLSWLWVEEISEYGNIKGNS